MLLKRGEMRPSPPTSGRGVLEPLEMEVSSLKGQLYLARNKTWCTPYRLAKMRFYDGGEVASKFCSAHTVQICHGGRNLCGAHRTNAICSVHTTQITPGAIYVVHTSQM